MTTWTNLYKLASLATPSVPFPVSGIPEGGKILGRLERRVKAHVVDWMGLFLEKRLTLGGLQYRELPFMMSALKGGGFLEKRTK